MIDLTTEYRNGTRRSTCPKCLGGNTGELSFSLWHGDNGRIHGTCWRDACRYFTVDARVDPNDLLLQPEPFVPNPLRKSYRAKELGLYGERVLVEDPTTTVWILRDMSGTRTGHITRTADKRILTYKEVDRPVYYWNGRAAYDALWLFEDPRSAAMCPTAAVALLGTSLPSSLLADIQAAFRRTERLVVFVALDPGAELSAGEIHKRLRDGGVTAVFVPMQKDFKDMTEAERTKLMETYS